jgi:tetratricopeptide (TPR) repeat protein
MSKLEEHSGKSEPVGLVKGAERGEGDSPTAKKQLLAGFGKLVLPLAIALGVGIIAYTLITPDQAGERNSSGTEASVEDCAKLLASYQALMAQHALTNARQALALAPLACKSNPDWRASEAELLVLEGEVAVAKKLAERALTEQPKSLPARRAQCLIFAQAGEHQQALQCFQRLLAEAPDDLATVFRSAVAAQEADHYRGAREGFLKTLRIEPKHIEARYRLALITHAIGAKAESANHVEKLKKIAPLDDPRVSRAAQLRSSSAKPSPPNPVSANPSAVNDLNPNP